MSLAELSSFMGLPVWALVIVTVWTIVWKGLALWKSARNNAPVWFILILLINTIGFLEIFYIFLFSKIDLSKYNSGKAKKKVEKGLIDKKIKKKPARKSKK